MKAQNKEEKLAKQQEREKLQREIAAREKAEKLQVKYLYLKVQLDIRKKHLICKGGVWGEVPVHAAGDGAQADWALHCPGHNQVPTKILEC